MPKKNPENAPVADNEAPVVAPKAGALATTASSTFGTLAGFKAEDTRGKEGIESSDLRLPFLSLAQKTSKALDATEDSYIDGLTFGDMYNSETKDIYGKEPMAFIPLCHRKRAYLPDENGRMGEQIEWNDPRNAWPNEEQKKAWASSGKKGKPKPEGVRVYDWVVLLMLQDGPQLAVISFKGKSFAAGQSLTTFVSMVKGPAFTAKYKICAQLESNDAGKFGKFAVLPAGKPTNEEALFAELIYDSVKDKNLAPPTDDGEPDETEPTAAETAAAPKDPKNTPF